MALDRNKRSTMERTAVSPAVWQSATSGDLGTAGASSLGAAPSLRGVGQEAGICGAGVHPPRSPRIGDQRAAEAEAARKTVEERVPGPAVIRAAIDTEIDGGGIDDLRGVRIDRQDRGDPPVVDRRRPVVSFGPAAAPRGGAEEAPGR